jgi:hypothetical protein
VFYRQSLKTNFTRLLFVGDSNMRMMLDLVLRSLVRTARASWNLVDWQCKSELDEKRWDDRLIVVERAPHTIIVWFRFATFDETRAQTVFAIDAARAPHAFDSADRQCTMMRGGFVRRPQAQLPRDIDANYFDAAFYMPSLWWIGSLKADDDAAPPPIVATRLRQFAAFARRHVAAPPIYIANGLIGRHPGFGNADIAMQRAAFYRTLSSLSSSSSSVSSPLVVVDPLNLTALARNLQHVFPAKHFFATNDFQFVLFDDYHSGVVLLYYFLSNCSYTEIVRNAIVVAMANNKRDQCN